MSCTSNRIPLAKWRNLEFNPLQSRKVPKCEFWDALHLPSNSLSAQRIEESGMDNFGGGSYAGRRFRVGVVRGLWAGFRGGVSIVGVGRVRVCVRAAPHAPRRA